MASEVYLDYNIKSLDGIDEVVSIEKPIIDDVKDSIATLKEIYGDDLSDMMFEVFITVALIQGVEFIRKNKKQIIELVGDNDGNKNY